MMKLLKHPWIFLIGTMILTVVVKIPHLGFPFFFDETFSYYPAILKMAELGPGLMPGDIPLILSKGHPLFFYFVASLWVKYLAGNSIVLMRIFPLIVTLISLYVFHRFARRHINILIANIGVLLLALQPLFMAQASLVLPEIFLFTLFMLCFDAYLSGNFGWYALFGSLMMLTKETGGVFIAIFGLAFIIENFKELKTKKFWTHLILMGIPVFVYGIFLILHYRKFGVFFYPEHLGYITLDPTKVLYKFSSSTSTLFLSCGKNFLFFTAVIALFILLFAKKRIEFKRYLILSLVTLIAYLIFTILNFYIYRYMLPVQGIMLLSCLVLVRQIKTKYKVLNAAFILTTVIVSTYYLSTKRGQSDVDLGYTQFLVVQQEMVQYLEKNNMYNKEIGSGFNMVMALRDRYGRYLSTDRNFKPHHLPGIKDRDIIIYDSTCWPYEMPADEKNKLKLIKHFQYKQHWGDIYATPASMASDTTAQKPVPKI